MAIRFSAEELFEWFEEKNRQFSEWSKKYGSEKQQGLNRRRGLYAVMSGDKYLWNGDYLELPNFIILWICVIVVTTGLIYTFRDKKNK